MSQLPENAVARLTMLEGNLCSVAELSMFLEQYEYMQDPTNINRYVIVSNDSPNGECALEVENDGEAFVVYGTDSDHFTSLNYVMSKVGWTRCSVVSLNADVEAKLLSRLVSVEIDSATANMPASSLHASAPAQPQMPQSPASNIRNTSELAISTPGAGMNDDAPAHNNAQMSHAALSPLASLDEAHSKIDELTRRSNRFEEQAETSASANDVLTETNRQLQLENARLVRELAETQRNMPTAGAAPLGLVAPSVDSSNDAKILAGLIETFMLPQLGINGAESSPFLGALRKAGYDVRLSLAKVA